MNISSPIGIPAFTGAGSQSTPIETTNTTSLSQTSSVTHPLNDKTSQLTTKQLVQNATPELTQLKAAKIAPGSDEATAIMKTIVADAELADFPYRQNSEALKQRAPDWKVDHDMSTKIFEDAGLSGKHTDTNGFTTDNGLSVFLFKKEAKDGEPAELRLVFGGTTAGSKAAGFKMRNVRNPLTTVKQWLANAKNVFSGTPASYKEAANIADKLRLALPEGSKLSFSGHSKGGGEASYAAMMLAAKTGLPFKAVNFSSAELGQKLKQNIASTLLESGHANADNLTKRVEGLSAEIVHLKVKGDAVPVMHKIFSKISHLGKTLTVQENSSKLHQMFNPLNKHNDFAAIVSSSALDMKVSEFHKQYV